ncbi:hypothetical protein ACSBR2_004936 [Camellia fascicularis]
MASQAQIAVSRRSVLPVYHTCSANELFTMTCQGTHAVVAICLVVGSVEKVNALNFVFALRFFFALQIQLHQHVSCCKMSSTYRPHRGFMLCLQQLACIFSLVACITGIDELQEASQILSCFSDLVYCTVCACMQTQHKVEMDKRDGKFGPPAVMAVPPAQHMSRIDQGIPPPVGYPAPAYGQPYGYAQGYPPSGYPPSGYPPSGYPPSGYPPSAYPQAGYPR